MNKLNLFKFELTSFELLCVGSEVPVSAQWQKDVMKFAEMHCSHLKKLQICGDLHDQEFPLKCFLRLDSSDEIFMISVVKHNPRR